MKSFIAVSLTLLPTLFRSSYSHPHPFQASDEGLLETRQSSLVVTTGVPGSEVYPRLEITQLVSQEPDQWALLVLALQQFENVSQNSPTSFYQIAGIHGVPRQNFNGVGQCATCGDANGYCTHDSVLFPAWHRTYIALFEQQIVHYANQVVQQYPSDMQPAMQAAANCLRWPYWDWAAIPPNGGPTLPAAVSSPQVTINGPNGNVTMKNPFYSYHFTDTSGMYYWPFVQWPDTYRYPNTDNSDAFSQENLCESALDSVRPNIQDQVYQLMTTCDNYLYFSNDDAGSSSASCSNSLEGIHNIIHLFTGGGGNQTTAGGHMTYLPTSAFDPIFFLHHCNVDRLFAIWQTINPDSYGASQTAPHNTWTIRAGSTQNADSPLTPFFKDNSGDFWSTNMVRNWSQTFHYTYPEFYNSDGSQASIISYVNDVYGPSATAGAGYTKRDAASPTDPLTASNGSLYQYVANVVTPRYALNDSYTIYLFSGEPTTPSDATTFVHDPALIGPIGVLAQFNAPMSHGSTSSSLLSTGSVPLTRSLTAAVAAGQLDNLREASVVPFLREHLQWRIVASSGRIIDPADVPGFELSVVVSTATPTGDNTRLPVYSDFVTLVDVTDGLTGGLSRSSALRGSGGHSG